VVINVAEVEAPNLLPEGSNGTSNKFIFRATYANSIVCNIFPA
jgi:hypothetical protein